LLPVRAGEGALRYVLIDAIFVGTCVGLFEQFCVQSLRGRWLKTAHIQGYQEKSRSSSGSRDDRRVKQSFCCRQLTRLAWRPDAEMAK